MGIEIIEGYEGAGVVSRKLISHVVRSDMPLDGGWGYEPEEPDVVEAAAPPATTTTTMSFPAWREAEAPIKPDEIVREAIIARAKAEAMAGIVVPEGGQVEFIPTLPYSGTEPIVQAFVRQPANHPDLPA